MSTLPAAALGALLAAVLAAVGGRPGAGFPRWGALLAALLAGTTFLTLDQLTVRDNGQLAHRTGPGVTREFSAAAAWTLGHLPLTVLPTLTGAGRAPGPPTIHGQGEIPAAALLDHRAPQPPTGLVPFIGITGLLLALAGFAIPRWDLARAALLAGVLAGALAPNSAVLAAGQVLTLAALAALAGRGAAWLGGRGDTRDGPAPAYLAAAAGTGLTGALVWASLAAGTATDAVALGPFLELLPDAATFRADLAALAHDADALRHAFDRAALAAFLGLTSLLAWLRWRQPALALTVALVALAEIALTNS